MSENDDKISQSRTVAGKFCRQVELLRTIQATNTYRYNIIYIYRLTLLRLVLFGAVWFIGKFMGTGWTLQHLYAGLITFTNLKKSTLDI